MKKQNFREYDELLKKINSEDALERAIKEFMLSETKEYHNLHKLYYDLFGVLPIPAIKVDPREIENNLKLYRARSEPDVSEPKSLKEYTYPSMEVFTATQRANWYGRNVFYGSDSISTVLQESKEFSVGRKFFVSKWGFNFRGYNDDVVRLIPLGFEQIQSNNPWRRILNMDKNLEESLKDYTPTEKHMIKRFFNRMGDLFLADDYTKSAFIADQILYNSKVKKNSGELLPILIYPSVATGHNTCNFAIYPEFVDSYLELEKVVNVETVSSNAQGADLRIEKIGIRSNQKSELSWYFIDYNLQNPEYKVNSVSCQCGIKMEQEHLVDVEFFRRQDDTKISLTKLVSGLLTSKNYPDILIEPMKILEADDLIIGQNFDVKLEASSYYTIYEGATHGKLIFEISLDVKYRFSDYTW